MMTTSPLLAVLVFVMLGTSASGAEQMDLSKILVGTWEGEIQRQSKGQETGRTLIIETVREQDGKWIVDAAKWGIHRGNIHPVDAVLNVSGSDVNLELDKVGAGGGKLSLKLVKDEALVGTILTGRGPTSIELRKAK